MGRGRPRSPIPVTLHTFSPEVIAAAEAMAALPTDQVRAELAPLWERLRAGTLPSPSCRGNDHDRGGPGPLPAAAGALGVAGRAGRRRAHLGSGRVSQRPGMGVTVFRWAALLLGLGGVVLAAPETDPQDLLRAGPVPRWRTLALRLATWLALGRRRSWPWRRCWTAWPAGPPPTWPEALPGFGLATASAFLAAGGVGPGRRRAAMAAAVALSTAGRAWPAWFRIVLASIPATPLAVQPGLDGRAQLGTGGRAGAGGSHPEPHWPCVVAARRSSPASEVRARP